MRVNCLSQEHNTVPWSGLEPGSLDSESSALTIRTVHLPFSFHTLDNYMLAHSCLISYRNPLKRSLAQKMKIRMPNEL